MTLTETVLLCCAGVSLLCCLATLATVLALLRRQPPADTHGPALLGLQTGLGQLAAVLREEGRAGRDELRGVLHGHQAALEARLAGDGQSQRDQLAVARREATEGRGALEEALKRNADGFAHTQTTRLAETNQAMRDLASRLHGAHEENRTAQRQALDDLGTRLHVLTETNDKRQEAIRETLHGNLQQLRVDNEAKLEQMRVTVDEKLQGTLEARLGESFRSVSERLEHVHRGLGEMQALATGVGDLKRVLTNVKSRGGWGEVQLGALLEDLLTPEQFGRNVKIRPDSGEMVEFAVRLPGRGEGTPMHLAIDAKFPHEDYERLLHAQEAGLPDEVERAMQALERAVRLQARAIEQKYIHPPHSTDFAIMYLPTEGLFAEVIRRPGLGRDLQNTHRVMVTGPTTLAALLNSLQMGFRTLAIEKRSSEVWQVLGAAKTEFRKYGEVWDKLGKQLDTAKKTVDEAGRRTRAVERQLREVESTPAVGEGGGDLLGLVRLGEEDEAA